jgi:hypothetical protein
VYELHNGAQRWAVRCFLRPVTSQQQRYAALSHHLQGLALPMLADCAYLPEGIRVRGQWYPIVRMAWIAGQQLHQYVEEHRWQGARLEQLAAQWCRVMAGLRGARIAHGDLQHGNILVDGQDQIRLVDYDGLFIPAVSSQPPGEVGHPNYQHPERLQQGYYAENGDAFSALVIYLSLVALCAAPDLWTLHTGENLLFTAADFTQPGRTAVWRRLQESIDPEVRRLTATLEDCCRGPVTAVPDLATVVPPPQPLLCPQCGHSNTRADLYCRRCTSQLWKSRPCRHGRFAFPLPFVPWLGQHQAPANARYCPVCGGDNPCPPVLAPG